MSMPVLARSTGCWTARPQSYLARRVGCREVWPGAPSLAQTSFGHIYRTGEIAAHVLTKDHADDATQVPTLLGQVEDVVASVTIDGAYNGEPTYAAAAARQRHPPPDAVVLLRTSAVSSTDGSNGGAQRPRDRHIGLREPKGFLDMAERDWMGWQRATGYGRRNQAQTAVFRSIHLISPKLRVRSLPVQRDKAAIAVAVLSQMIRTAKLLFVRIA